MGAQETIDFFYEKNEIQNLIKQNKFEELIKKFEINTEDFKNLSEEEKGEAYYSLGQALSHAKRTNPKQKAIIESYKIERNLEKAIICYWRASSLKNVAASKKLFQIYTNYEDFIDYEKAEIACIYGIKAEDPASCFNLGKLYYNGFSYTKDDKTHYKKDRKKAMELFEISVKSHPNWGGYELGCMYENGFYDCPIDLEKAFYYYLDAADYGDRLAMFRIANIYGSKSQARNFGVEFDKDAAILYYKNYLKLAEPDRRDYSIANVGILEHENGKTKEEKIDGIKKVLKTAKKGVERAQKYLENNDMSVEEPKKFDLSFMEK